MSLLAAVAHSDDPVPLEMPTSARTWHTGEPEVEDMDALLARAASTPGAPPSDPPQTVVRQAMTRFVAAGLVALLLVAAAVWVAASRAAEREAVEDARQRTITLASALLQPELVQGVVDGDPAAQAHFAALVRDRVLSDEVVRVKIWNRDGVIVWSDEPRLIGNRYDLGDEEIEVIESGGAAVAEPSDLERPENRFDAGHGPLLEVYLPVWAPDGETLLFETYQTRTAVDARQRDVLAEFAPITIGGTVLLLLVLVPVAWSLARSLDRARSERVRLLQHALDASTTERRRIAAHLHDGIVQSLAGSSYALSSVASTLRREPLTASEQSGAASTVGAVAGELRQGVRGLRSLLVEIYPAGLRRAGLGAALSDLTAQLSSREIDVELDVDDTSALPEPVEIAIFRVAQEAVRNIVKHAEATRVRLAIVQTRDNVTLVVADDGKGFTLPDPSRPSTATPAGHLGLALLEDSLAEVRGTLSVRTAPGQGTELTARIPLP
ncbi:MAG: sensor histidine kinase [Dehalococcoidia bacterium]